MWDWLKEIMPLIDIPWRNIHWAVLIFLVTYAASIIAVGFLLIRLPSNYFSESSDCDRSSGRRPGSWVVRLLKKSIGSFVVILGGMMALPGVPGPGLLIMLLGIMLGDFRGQHRFERWLIRRPGVLFIINTLRKSFGVPPIHVSKGAKNLTGSKKASHVSNLNIALSESEQD
jgi:hypothetical protein